METRKYTTEFIKKQLSFALYSKKENATTGYCRIEGEDLLPQTIYLTDLGEAKKGRQLGKCKAYSLSSNFTKKEMSCYKQYKPYQVRTSIWQSENYPQFIGYGTIGISGKDGKITRESDTGDLIVLYSPDNNQTIGVYVLKGMGSTPDEAMEYLTSII